jgi:hypothetical protein
MKWWEGYGKNDFPLLYYLAILFLPCPDSNGSQERTFSAATWMDDKLKKSQSDATFEMKVLIYKNEDFIRQSKVSMEKRGKELALQATKKMLAQAKERNEARRQHLKRGSVDDDGNDDAVDSEEDEDRDEYLEQMVEIEEACELEDAANALGAISVPKSGVI